MQQRERFGHDRQKTYKTHTYYQKQLIPTKSKGNNTFFAVIENVQIAFKNKEVTSNKKKYVKECYE